MTSLQFIEDKIKQLEEKIEKLEAKIAEYSEDDKYMEALYQKAKKIITKDNNTGIIHLQRKLLIDMERARKIMKQLEKDGVVGPPTGLGKRSVLIGK